MKILTIILWLLSVGNIISGIITLNNAPAEYKENATSSILMGIVFGVAAVACPYIKKM